MSMLNSHQSVTIYLGKQERETLSAAAEAQNMSVEDYVKRKILTDVEVVHGKVDQTLQRAKRSSSQVEALPRLSRAEIVQLYTQKDHEMHFEDALTTVQKGLHLDGLQVSALTEKILAYMVACRNCLQARDSRNLPHSLHAVALLLESQDEPIPKTATDIVTMLNWKPKQLASALQSAKGFLTPELCVRKRDGGYRLYEHKYRLKN